LSQELERVYTIPLGKVLLSANTHRAVRAINMIKEFARHHMKTYNVKIDEEISHIIWARGVRRPPRKIRVKMTKTEDGFILVSSYQDEVESVEEPEKISTPKVTEKIEAEKDEQIVEVDVGQKIDEDKSVIEEKPKAKAAPKKEEKPKAKAAPKKEEKPKAKAAPKKEEKPKTTSKKKSE
jgi:large subunit ribosomal protein L31e